MKINNLPGIKQISFIRANECFIYPKQQLVVGRNVSLIGTRHPMPIVELAGATVTDQITDNATIYTTKITGSIFDCDELTQEQRHELVTKYHAFEFTDVHNTKYLIGNNTKPFPQISFSPTIDNLPGGSRQIPFEILYISTLPPLESVSL